MCTTNFGGMGAELLARWIGTPGGRSGGAVGGLSSGAVRVEAGGGVGSGLHRAGVEREGRALGEGGRRPTAVIPWSVPAVGRGAELSHLLAG